MPFLQRVIEPEHVCRNTLPLDDQGVLAVEVPNELECVTNGTLANVIRQLSSLSKHAEDMFTSLFRESTAIVSRTNSLQGRIDRLAIKVTQLDSTVEEVSLQDIHMRKAFKSYIVYEQQVVSRESMPAAIRDTYLTCDKPPPLDKLNPYREDGKDGLKFYTDPNYFFDLWKQEMLKDTEKILHDRGKKLAHSKESAEPNHHRPKPECKKHKKTRQPHLGREKIRHIPSAKEADTPNYFPAHYAGAVSRLGNHIQADPHPVRPNSLELPSSYFTGQHTPHAEGAKPQYPPPPPAYTERPLSPQHHYPPPPYIATSIEQQGTPSSSTPTRNVYRMNSMRPAQPPPAPPVTCSSSSSGSSTPTVSGGTPSSGGGRYRSHTPSRENLPPPPPPPTDRPTVNNIPSPSHVISKVTQPSESSPETPNHVVVETSAQGTPTHDSQNRTKSSSSSSGSSKTSPSKTVDEQSVEETDLPPPPPSPKEVSITRSEEKTPPPASIPPVPALISVAPLPPPPPPPLPPLDDLVMEIVANSSLSDSQNAEVVSITSESASETSSISKISEPTEVKSKVPGSIGPGDARSDLLAAIREGIKLRRVEDIKQKEVEKAAPLHDVASILARRVAMEFSDSESPSDSEYDSEGWEDESECPKT